MASLQELSSITPRCDPVCGGFATFKMFLRFHYVLTLFKSNTLTIAIIGSYLYVVDGK